MRHYEIIANGCLPVFPNIESCPEKTMFLLPKDLLIKCNELYEKFDITKDIDKYKDLMNKLLEYTRTHLTTIKIAEYILEKTNNKNVSKILYLSGNLYPDYLRCLTLHGFKTLIKHCQDYLKVPHIYKNHNIRQEHLYGMGFTYSELLEQEPEISLDSVISGINNKYYDIVIYGSYHRGNNC